MDDPLDQRCSGFARAEDLDPAGTAGSHRGFAAVEVPLPWPSDIAEHPDLAGVAPALAAAGLRLQGLVPGPERDPGGDRCVLGFLRPAGPFDRYRAGSWSAPAAALADTLAGVAAAAASSTSGASAADGPGAGAAGALDAGTAAGATAAGGADRHVLVCTHGRRDACCGALGTRLSTALPGLGPGVRVWRTSHTGGHRFAPTALLLPEGTAWAYLDLDTLVGIVDRTLPVDEAARRYRGCTGLDGPEVQAAEREALRRVGWSWLDHRRSGTVVERDGARALVRLEATGPDGAGQVFEAAVEVARVLPVPDCGRPLTEARKTAPEWRVSEFAAA
ncbi:MAG TPA: sucrase ferredoxin [Acidimicrobiales bacterium]